MLGPWARLHHSWFTIASQEEGRICVYHILFLRLSKHTLINYIPHVAVAEIWFRALIFDAFTYGCFRMLLLIWVLPLAVVNEILKWQFLGFLQLTIAYKCRRLDSVTQVPSSSPVFVWERKKCLSQGTQSRAKIQGLRHPKYNSCEVPQKHRQYTFMLEYLK